MKPIILILRWRDGRVERRFIQPDWPIPERFSPYPIAQPRTWFRLGTHRDQFAHVGGRELECHVAKYFEEVPA